MEKNCRAKVGTLSGKDHFWTFRKAEQAAFLRVYFLLGQMEALREKVSPQKHDKVEFNWRERNRFRSRKPKHNPFHISFKQKVSFVKWRECIN